MTTQTPRRVTLEDTRLQSLNLETMPLVARLRKQHFQTKPGVCVERARWITRSMQHPEDPHEPAIVRRARAVTAYLSNRVPVFLDENLLAGSTTSRAIGAPVYPEFLGLTIWPELETISNRAVNPQSLSQEDADLLNFEVFPYWMERNVQEVTRRRYENPVCMRLFERIVFYINGKAGCISHCVPSYEVALHQGLRSVAEEARRKEAEAAGGAPGQETRSKAAFYRAVQVSLQGIMDYARNLSAKAAELARGEPDAWKRKNLETMSAVCSRVPSEPARSFREAVNSLWLCQVALHAENVNMAMSPGRLDQVLHPFYKKDMEAGTLTVEEALTLCCCLWLKIADNTNLVPEQAERLWGGAGSTPAVTLGGVDANGDDAVNDLTYVLLRTTELMALRDPSVNARYNYEKNDLQYRQRVCEVIVNTRAIPALHNDIPAIKTLVNQGVKPEHARDFGIVGCVELASTGRDYVASSSIMFNLCAPMEMALLNGKRLVTGDEQIGPQTGDPASFTSFEQFWEAFKAQLKWLLDQAVDMNEKFGEVHQQMLPTPLLSAFFEGPMESGRDLIFGGALYNSSGGSHVAFPDVCDSLNAVEYAVFMEKRMTMAQMIEAVRADFAAPHDQFLAYLKNKTPKFGTEHPVALKNAQNLIQFIYEVYQSKVNYRGGRYRPAYWTMTTHAGQGKLAGALPSGRKAHEVFSSGITPASQAAQNLVEAYNAVASLRAETFIPGGQALNIKYTPPLTGESGQYLKAFGDLVEGYFRQGGLQAQFNVQTYETLIDARRNPQNYPEMIVRVSGYSAYFKDLSDAMKDELIMRTQYALQSQRAVPLPSSYVPGENTAGQGTALHAPLTRDLNAVQKRILQSSLKSLSACLNSAALDDLLELLLGAMSVAFLVSPDFSRNIRGFKARYGFRSRDGQIACSAEFGPNLLSLPSMKVHRGVIGQTDILVTFKNGQALKDFLFTANPDIIGAMMDNAIQYVGNLNYLLKFAYMARHLQLQFMPHLQV